MSWSAMKTPRAILFSARGEPEKQIDDEVKDLGRRGTLMDGLVVGTKGPVTSRGAQR